MSKHLMIGTALAACLTSAPALADVSAKDIWAEWVALQGSQGIELTAASQSYVNGELILSGVTAQQVTPYATLIVRLDEIVMAEEPDGSLTFELSDTIAVTYSTVVDGEAFVLPLQITLENFIGSIEGEDTRDYSLGADKITTSFDLDAEDIRLRGALVATDYVVGLELSAGTQGPWAMTWANEIASVDYSFEAVNEEGGVKINGAVQQLVGGMEGTYRAPEAGQAAGPLDLGGELTYSNASVAGTIDLEGRVDTFDVTVGAGNSVFDFAPTEIFFANELSQVQGTFESGAMPFPIEVAIANTETAMTLPVGISDGAVPVSLKLAYRDIVLSDAIWGMFDPMGQLPRDALSFVLDLEGLATTFVDLAQTDFETLESAPGELNALTLNELLLTFGGANLSGTGDVTFKNEGSAYGPGVPQPIGTVTLNLTGAFALLDTLVAMGMLPPEQGQMAKMMSGMIAKPTGDDALTSELEFTPSGSVTANGLPLPF